LERLICLHTKTPSSNFRFDSGAPESAFAMLSKACTSSKPDHALAHSSVTGTLSPKQRQRARRSCAHQNSLTAAALKDRSHRREVKQLTKTIATLQQSAVLMDAKLLSLVSSSAADAKSIENLKDKLFNANACNRKWDREGARLLQDTKRLRSERDLARLLLPPVHPNSP
jgi:hypothetical protein